MYGMVRTAPEHHRRLMSLSSLARFILRPVNIILPIDHQMSFRAVVGASQGAGPLRMHMAKKLEVKILVAALLFGTIFEFVGFASAHHDSDAAETEIGALHLTVFDWVCWLYTIFCYTGACSAVLSIVLNAALLVNVLSCYEDNFDLLLDAAGYVFLYADVLNVVLIYACAFVLVLLPFLLQSHLLTGCILSGIMALCSAATVYSINLVSALTLYGGLVSKRRPCNARPWNFRGKRDGSETHAMVVDAIVRQALRTISSQEGVLVATSLQRMSTSISGRVSKLAAEGASRSASAAGIAKVMQKHSGARAAASHISKCDAARCAGPDEELDVESIDDHDGSQLCDAGTVMALASAAAAVPASNEEAVASRCRHRSSSA